MRRWRPHRGTPVRIERTDDGNHWAWRLIEHKSGQTTGVGLFVEASAAERFANEKGWPLMDWSPGPKEDAS